MTDDGNFISSEARPLETGILSLIVTYLALSDM